MANQLFSPENFQMLADGKTLRGILLICMFNYHREMLDDSGPTFKIEKKTPSESLPWLIFLIKLSSTKTLCFLESLWLMHHVSAIFPQVRILNLYFFFFFTKLSGTEGVWKLSWHWYQENNDNLQEQRMTLKWFCNIATVCQLTCQMLVSECYVSRLQLYKVNSFATYKCTQLSQSNF